MLPVFDLEKSVKENWGLDSEELSKEQKAAGVKDLLDLD